MRMRRRRRRRRRRRLVCTGAPVHLEGTVRLRVGGPWLEASHEMKFLSDEVEVREGRDVDADAGAEETAGKDAR